jgi:outer membrane protein TolC
LVGWRNAPSPIAMAGARFDVLAAELASERRRARTEIETARAFFDLLEKQQIASQFRAARAAKLRQGQELERLLQASRVTEVDRVTFQEELLSLEQQQVDIEMQRRLASVQLASLIGRLDDIESIEVDESPVAGAAFEQSLPPLEKLFESALFYRRETQLLREKIQDLRQKAGLPAAGPLEGISAGYAYLANGARDLASAARPNLLGGHTAQGGVSLSIPLRNTGERAAEKDLLLARIHALELEMRSMEEDLRSELLSMRSVVQAGMERLQLAARRLELSRQKSKMVHLRAENGLAGFAAAAGVEQAGLQAEAALVQARCAHRNSLFTLLVICGLHDQKETVQRQVAGS